MYYCLYPYGTAILPTVAGTREDGNELNQVEIPVLSNAMCELWGVTQFSSIALADSKRLLCVGYQEIRAGVCSVCQ